MNSPFPASRKGVDSGQTNLLGEPIPKVYSFFEDEPYAVSVLEELLFV